MNIFFFGDDQYSIIVLENLLKKHSVSAIITTQRKPKEKNHPNTSISIEDLAKRHNKKILYYNNKNESLNKIIKQEKNTPNSIGIIASFGHILPKKLINSFDHSIINIHPSLLPQFRGATPVQHTIALGKKTTGITIFKITSKIDKGKILAQKKKAIKPNSTTPQLTTKLFKLANQPLNILLQNNLKLQRTFKQEISKSKLIYTQEFTRETGQLNWSTAKNLILNLPLKNSPPQNKLLKLRLKTAKNSQPTIIHLFDLWRALTPWPGVWTITKTKKTSLRIKILFKNIDKLKTPINPDSLQKHLGIHIAGKPNPISLKDFKKYYL